MTHRPIVVEVAKFVGESLDMVWLEVRGIPNDVVVGGGDGALPYTLRHDKEVVRLAPRSHGIDDCARTRIAQVVALLGKEARVDSLLHHHNSQLWAENRSNQQCNSDFVVSRKADASVMLRTCTATFHDNEFPAPRVFMCRSWLNCSTRNQTAASKQ